MEEPLPSTSSVKEELPQHFNVRYLGFREAKGLWGIKHTRKPVDTMVTCVKESKNNLHVVKLIIAKDGCKLESIFNGKIETRYVKATFSRFIHTIIFFTSKHTIRVIKHYSGDGSPLIFENPFYLLVTQVRSSKA